MGIDETKVAKEVNVDTLATLEKFINAKCVVDLTATVDKQELFEAYKRFVKLYCKFGVEPLGRYKFHEHLNKKVPLKVFRANNLALRKYKGIGLIRSVKA